MRPAHYVLFPRIVPMSAFLFPVALIKHTFAFSAPGKFVLFFTIFVGGFHERNPILRMCTLILVLIIECLKFIYQIEQPICFRINVERL